MKHTDGMDRSGDSPGGAPGVNSEAEARLDRLFAAYREATPAPEPGVNYMPELWARIEQNQKSSNWFGGLAKGLVTAALAAYVILALMTPASQNRPSAEYFNGTFVDALVAEHVASLEPLHIERISQIQADRE